jgi:hypothetical protein
MEMELGRFEGLSSAARFVDSEVAIDLVDGTPHGVGKIENMDVGVISVVRIEVKNLQGLEPRMRISELCGILLRAIKEMTDVNGTRHSCVDLFLDEGQVNGGLPVTLMAQRILPVFAALEILKFRGADLAIEPLEMSLNSGYGGYNYQVSFH